MLPWNALKAEVIMETKNVCFRLDYETWKAIKCYCMDEKITLQELLVNYVKDLLND
jgi:hypothetical protein